MYRRNVSYLSMIALVFFLCISGVKSLWSPSPNPASQFQEDNTTNSVIPAAPGLHEFSIYQTEGFVTGNLGISGAAVYVQITNRGLSYNGTAGSNGWYTIGIPAGIQLGDIVQVSALGQSRQVTLPAAFSVVADPDNDIVSGIAPAGAVVHTELWREPVPSSYRFEFEIYTTADDSGQYAVDYGAAGKDITRANFVYAKYKPNGQDTVAIVSHPSVLRVNETQNLGYGYLSPSSSVSLRLLNSGGGVKAMGTVSSSWSGFFWVLFTNLDGSAVDIVPSDSVEASAGGTTVVLAIPSISAAVSGATMVSGSISPPTAGSPVGVAIIGSSLDDVVYTTQNAEGQFNATFEASHISQMQYGIVFYPDANGNQAFIQFTGNETLPTPTPPLNVPTASPTSSPVSTYTSAPSVTWTPSATPTNTLSPTTTPTSTPDTTCTAIPTPTSTSTPSITPEQEENHRAYLPLVMNDRD